MAASVMNNDPVSCVLPSLLSQGSAGSFGTSLLIDWPQLEAMVNPAVID